MLICSCVALSLLCFLLTFCSSSLSDVSKGGRIEKVYKTHMYVFAIIKMSKLHGHTNTFDAKKYESGAYIHMD